MPLPPRAVGVLAALVANAGTVVSKQALLDSSWRDTFVTEASLLEAIRLLRQALNDDRLNPTYIQTVHRRGYRFIAEVKAVDADQHSSGADGPNPWRPLIAASASAVLATVAMAMVFAFFGQRPPDARPTMRFSIALPDNMVIDPLRGSIAVSPDGTRMVYVATEDGQRRLLLRTIDRDTIEPIAGSEGAADPFFSPDGQWIGFFAQGSLKKLPVEGGAAVVLTAARAGAGATWAPDGTIVFGGGPGGGLARVPADGGTPIVLAAPEPGSRDVTFGWPDLLPDGRRVVFTAIGLAGSTAALLNLSTGQRVTLVEGAAFARYSPTGHLVFERRGHLEAAPFAVASGRVSTPPRAVLRGLATGTSASTGPHFAFSRTGSLVYVPGATGDGAQRLHWLDADGQLEPVATPSAPIGSVDVAPNSRQLAVTAEGDRGQDLWIGDLDRGAWSRLPAEGQSISPTWRPDGLAIAFAYSKTGPFNVFVRPTDASGAPRPLIESPWNQFPTSWSGDGRLLAFTEYHPMTGADIWLLDLDTRERRVAVRTLFDESHARFSPDGKWLASMSNESGRWDVFVRPAHGSGSRLQLSTTGGAWPCWSVDGRTLYFSVGGRTAAVAITTSPTLQASAPMLIPGRDDLQLVTGRADFARVLVRQDGAASTRHELRVVLEWFSELTRLVRRPA